MSSDTSKHHHTRAGGTIDTGTPALAATPIVPGIPLDLPALPSNGGGSTVVFDSIGDSLDDAWPPNEGVVAQSFTTGASTSTISEVQLSLSTFDAGAGGTVSVELWSDSSTQPGASLDTLGTIGAASLTGSFETYNFTVTDAPTMTDDTRYWIEVTSSVDNVEWGATFSTSGTEVSSEFQDTNGNVNPDSGAFGEAFLMSVTTEAACFAAGTRIRTARGEVAVEALRPGDRVIAARSGRHAPVRWIGHRRLAPARHPRPWDVNPVRIRAGALGPGCPVRDLLLSPDHALFLGGILVRARDLMNGATVVQEDAAEITYYHVELDRHDVLFAEGAPAEGFLDTGNRAAFENGGAAAMAHPEFSRTVWTRDACAELVWQGPRLAAARAQLAGRAGQIGWALTEQPDFHVACNGRLLPATEGGGAFAVELPPGAAEICLRSRSTVPAYVLPDSIDTRRIGVAVRWLRLDGVAVPLDGAALAGGWLAPEPGLRWTDGAGRLCVGGARRLEVEIARLGLPYWVPPESAAAPAVRAA